MKPDELQRRVKKADNHAQRTEPKSLIMQSRKVQKFAHRTSDAMCICEPSGFKMMISKLALPKISLTQFLQVLTAGKHSSVMPSCHPPCQPTDALSCKPQCMSFQMSGHQNDQHSVYCKAYLPQK